MPKSRILHGQPCSLWPARLVATTALFACFSAQTLCSLSTEASTEAGDQRCASESDDTSLLQIEKSFVLGHREKTAVRQPSVMGNRAKAAVVREQVQRSDGSEDLLESEVTSAINLKRYQKHAGLVDLYTDPKNSVDLLLDFTDLLKRKGGPKVLMTVLAAKGTYVDELGFVHYLHEPVEETQFPMYQFTLSSDNKTVHILNPPINVRSSDKSTQYAYNKGVKNEWMGDITVLSTTAKNRTIIDGIELIQSGLFVTPAAVYKMQSYSILEAKSYKSNFDLTVEFLDAFGFVNTFTYSVTVLPEDPMPGRVNDERLMYFAVEYQDIGVHTDDFKSASLDIEHDIDPVVPLIWRYDLRKGQIRIHVDYSVPKEFRPAFKKGIENWNQAFKLVGYPNAIRAVCPEDSDWPADYDAGDARFSTITWDINTESIFSMGIAKVDPRSGEIIKSDIIMSQGWVLSWLTDLEHLDLHQTHKIAQGYRHERRVPPDDLHRGRASLTVRKAATSGDWPRKTNASAAPGGLRLLQTSRARASGKDVSFLEQTKAVLMVAGVPERSWYQAAQDGLTDVVMHEVGHCLGLRHNFKGSMGVSYECTQDWSCSSKHGITASVMDYIPTNIPSTGTENVHLFTPVLGAYDILAIKFGYMQTFTQSEEKGGVPITPPILKEVLAEADAMPMCSDDESYYSEDPLCQAYDFTSEPLRYWNDQLLLLKKLQVNLLNRTVDPGGAFFEYGAIVSSLLRKAFHIQETMFYWLGGVIVSRMHRSLNGVREEGLVPVQPIPVEQQRQALQMILEIMDPYEAGFLPPMEALRLMVEKIGDFQHRLHVPSMIQAQQKLLLEALLRSSSLVAFDESKDIGGLSADILLKDMVAHFMGDPDGAKLLSTAPQHMIVQEQFVDYLAQPRKGDDALPEDIGLDVVNAMVAAKQSVEAGLDRLGKLTSNSTGSNLRSHLQIMRKKLKDALHADGIALPEEEAKSMAAAHPSVWLCICLLFSKVSFL